MKKKLITCMVTCCCAILLHNIVVAAPIEGNSFCLFINPVGGSGMIVDGVGTDTFSYGDPSDFGAGPNWLNFTGNSFASEIESTFSLGTLTYFNGTTLTGTTPNSVDLSINLSITNPSIYNQNFDFNLDLVSTTNTDDPVASADYVYLPSMYPGTIFTINDTDYTLKLFFGQSGSGGFTEIDKFHVLENNQASAEVLGVITTDIHPIPLPGAVWLLGSGLAGLVAAHRKKRN